MLIPFSHSGQIYYIDHLNEVTSWIHPSELPNQQNSQLPLTPPQLQAPSEPANHENHEKEPKRNFIGTMAESLEGEVIDVILCKGERGFGFTIVGGDDPGEMIQINAIVATGNDNRTGKHQNIHIKWCSKAGVFKISSFYL